MRLRAKARRIPSKADQASEDGVSITVWRGVEFVIIVLCLEPPNAYYAVKGVISPMGKYLSNMGKRSK